MSQEVDEIISALQNPAQAPFKVNFQFFASPDRKKFVRHEKDISELEKQPPSNFFLPSKRATISPEEAVAEKRIWIEKKQNNKPSPEKILKAIDVDKKKYIELKKSIEETIKKLDLKDPLIFFDDKALRIDVGYGLNECKALHIIDENEDIFGKLAEFCMWGSYRNSLEREKNALYPRATIRFSEPLPQKKIFSLSEIGSLNEAIFINKCMQNNEGLVIGDDYSSKTSKQFLIDRMMFLRSQDVRTLYMGDLLHEPHQKLLDTYLKSPMDAPMPKRLEFYLTFLDKKRRLEGPATFTNIVKSAKRNGMHIVAIGSEVTYQVEIQRTLEDEIFRRQLKAMNMGMLEQFSKYDHNGKYVVFIGCTHVSTCEEVPGISDLLGCPNIMVRTLEKGEQGIIKQNIQYSLGSTDRIVNFDFLYYRYPKTETLLETISLESTVELTANMQESENEATGMIPQCRLF